MSNFLKLCILKRRDRNWAAEAEGGIHDRLRYAAQKHLVLKVVHVR